MQHADVFAVRRFQPVAVEALVLPDGLEQFFRRHGTAVAQDVDGAAALAPGGVKVFRAGIHNGVFCAIRPQSQDRKILLILIVILILEFQTARMRMTMRTRRIEF